MRDNSYKKCANDAYKKLISTISEKDSNPPTALASNTIKHIVGNARFYAMKYAGFIKDCGSGVYALVGMEVE